MYAVTKTYKDFNGVERTETKLFNLTETEVMEMEFSHNSPCIFHEKNEEDMHYTRPQRFGISSLLLRRSKTVN